MSRRRAASSCPDSSRQSSRTCAMRAWSTWYNASSTSGLTAQTRSDEISTFIDISPMTTLDVAKLRKDFPMLARADKDGKRFAYLDTASSSQTPVQVLEAQDAFYFTSRANVHRGMYG